MRAWVVRGGRDGEFESYALENKVAVMGWSELGDLSGTSSLEDVREMVQQQNPDMNPGAVGNYSKQLFRSAHVIEPGHLVVMPCKTTRSLAFGRCAGPYKYRAPGESYPDIRHTRSVEWIRTDVPRHAIDQDLLYSLARQ